MSELRIKKLELKYWQGETSLEEEKELKSAVKNMPEALSPEFIQLVVSLNDDENSNAQLDDSFESEFWAAVEEKGDPKIIRRRFTPLEFIRYAAAAVVLLCFSFGLWYALGETEKSSLTATVSQQEEIQTPEEAFEEAKQALFFASSKLNKAKKPVQKIEKFHQATLSVASMTYNKTAKDSKNEND